MHKQYVATLVFIVYFFQITILKSESQPIHCQSCSPTSGKKLSLNNNLKKYPVISSLSTIFLILLPKCPLCIMAYSGTFLFWLDVEYSSLSTVLKIAQPVLIAFVIASVLRNYHGRKTVYSVLIILLSSFFIIYESFTMVEIIDKRFAIAAIFLACWFNGNFAFFINAVKWALESTVTKLK